MAPASGIWGDAAVQCWASDSGADAQLIHLDSIALLQMLDANPDAPDCFRQAENLTFVHLGVRLLKDLARHSRGDPEVPLSARIAELFTALEARIPGAEFVPERFSYVPAESFRGRTFGAIDWVYATVFLLGAERLRLASLLSGLERVSAWRESLVQRRSVIEVWAEIPH